MLNLFNYTDRAGLMLKIKQAAFERSARFTEQSSCGTTTNSLNNEIVELMIIHNFLPYFCADDFEKQKCYLREKFNVQ